jgi:hypothetical protein
MLPQLAPKHESVHVTDLLFVKLPAAVAVNCCVPPTFSDAVPGETAEIVTGTRLTIAVALLLLSALEVAVTVTVVALATGEGAV